MENIKVHARKSMISIASFLLSGSPGSNAITATTREIQAKEISRIREILDGIIAQHSGQDPKKVRKDTERDHYMTGEEALKYGLIIIFLLWLNPTKNPRF